MNLEVEMEEERYGHFENNVTDFGTWLKKKEKTVYDTKKLKR